MTTGSKFIDCTRSESLFEFIDKYWTKKSRKVAHRICTLMRKMGAQGVAVEGVPPDSTDYDRFLPEFDGIATRLGGRLNNALYKITFFDEYPKNGVLSGSQLVLGYLFLVQVKWNDVPYKQYVVEAVIRELGKAVEVGDKKWWKPLPRHFLHVSRRFEGLFEGHPFDFRGTYFCQQNGITSVCAHACAVMMLNNAPDASGELITTESLNETLGLDHVDVQIQMDDKNVKNHPKAVKGLTLEELTMVFEERGYEVESQMYMDKEALFRPFLYRYIESGFPALLAFQTASDDHVVAVAGHTLNSHSWLPLALKTYAVKDGLTPGARYLKSLNWVDDFLVHDDNVGMQLTLPAHTFQDVDALLGNLKFGPKYAMGIMPKSFGIKINAQDAEENALKYLEFLRSHANDPVHKSSNYYVRHLLPHFDVPKNTAVFRTTYVTLSNYLEHLKRADKRGQSINEEAISVIREALKDFKALWLVEVSEPDLFVGNRAKTMDILVDPTLPALQGDNKGWHLSIRGIRIPEKFLLRSKRTSSFKPIGLLTKSHVPMYGVDPNDAVIEW